MTSHQHTPDPNDKNKGPEGTPGGAGNPGPPSNPPGDTPPETQKDPQPKGSETPPEPHKDPVPTAGKAGDGKTPADRSKESEKKESEKNEDNSVNYTRNVHYNAPIRDVVEGLKHAGVLPTSKSGPSGYENLLNWATAWQPRSSALAIPGAEEWREMLDSGGLLALRGADPDLLLEAPDCVASGGGYARFRRLTAGTAELPATLPGDFLIRFLRADLDEWRRNGGDESGLSLTVVYVNDDAFVSSFAGGLWQFQHLGRDLAAAGCHVLFILYPLPLMPGDREIEGRIPVRAVPDLSVRISRATKWAPDKVAGVVTKIEDQRRRGLWDNDPVQFIRRVRQLLADPEEFLRAVESPDACSGPATAPALNGKTTVVERAALFIAGFVPLPTVKEFDEMMEIVLENRTMPGPAPAVAPGSPPAEPPRGDAVKIWKEEDDTELRDRCGLKQVRAPGGAFCYDFADLGDSLRVREELSALFAAECFDRLMRGLYFGLSRDRRAFVAKLAALGPVMAERYPDRFGDGWLRSIVLGIQHTCARQFASELHGTDIDSLGDLFEALKKATATERGVRQQMESSLVTLCECMIAHPVSKPAVMRFIDRLIEEGAFSPARMLARRLFPLVPADSLRWLKRCLFEQSPEDGALEETLTTLCELAHRGPHEFDVVLQTAFSWVPAAGQTGTSVGLSALVQFPITIAPLRDGITDPLPVSSGLPQSERWSTMAAWLYHTLLDQEISAVLSGTGLLGDQEIQDKTAEIQAWVLLEWAFRLGRDHFTPLADACRDQLQSDRRKWSRVLAAHARLVDIHTRVSLSAREAAARNRQSADLRARAAAAIERMELAKLVRSRLKSAD